VSGQPVYRFTAELWPWETRRDLWTFVTLPDDASEDVATIGAGLGRGFRSVPVRVRIGTTTWRTSVFPLGDGYVLPVKRAVRDANGLDLGDEVAVELELLL
jgi:Domain of unknown function (DUF1905)